MDSATFLDGLRSLLLPAVTLPWSYGARSTGRVDGQRVHVTAAGPVFGHTFFQKVRRRYDDPSEKPQLFDTAWEVRPPNDCSSVRGLSAVCQAYLRSRAVAMRRD